MNSLSGENFFDPVKTFRATALDGAERPGSHLTVIERHNGDYQGWIAGCMGQFPEYCYSPYSEKKSKVKYVYTSLWCHDLKEIDQSWNLWKFCLNPQWSPWRSILKDREIIMADDKPIAYRLTITDDTPIQTTMSLMLACRMAYSQDGYVRMFNAMREAGFTNTESLYITANVRLTPKGVITYPYIGDYPFDTAWDDISWSNWKAGTPRIAPTKKVVKGDHYTPLNAIWSANNKYSGSNYEGTGRKATKLQLLLSGATKTNYHGVFKKHYDSGAEVTKPVNAVTLQEAVKILKDNQEKWKVG